MGFETPALPKKEKSNTEKDKQMGLRTKAGAAALMGALAQSPDALAADVPEVASAESGKPTAVQMEDTLPDTEKAGKRTILYSEYAQGKRLPMDPEDAQEELERVRREMMARPDWTNRKSPVEEKIDVGVESVRKRLLVDEALSYSRDKLGKALDEILEKTGVNPGSAVGMGANMVLHRFLSGVDEGFTGVLREKIISGLPKSEQEEAAANLHRYDGKAMMFSHTLGSGRGWEVSAGADPGIGDKTGPRAGITFRMRMP